MNQAAPTSLATLVAPLLASALLGCGAATDFEVRGVGVVVATPAPFAHRPDFRERIESTIDAALGYWGGRWSDLDGMTIELDGAPSVACGGRTALGCYDGDIRLSTQDAAVGTLRCVEQTVLVHEIGHAVLGDAAHEDPRWMMLDPLGVALAGRRGYSDVGETQCELWLSMWRHPPGE